MGKIYYNAEQQQDRQEIVNPNYMDGYWLGVWVFIELFILVYLVSHADQGRQRNQRKYPIRPFNEYYQHVLREHGRFRAVFYFCDGVEFCHQIHQTEIVVICFWCDRDQLVCPG